MAVGDITACRIADAAAHNGWVAEIDIEGLAVAGTYAFGLGANNDPSTAKIVFTVTSQGFDASGQATTIERTIYGTQWVRKASPDQATADEAESGGTLTVRVALSDFIYDPDTSITVTIGAGFYTQGTASNAVSGLSVTNNSTLAYPKVIGRWAWPAFETVQSNFLLEAVCFHRSAINGKPVAAVVFEVTDGSATETVTVTEMTVSTRSGDANPVLVYAATIPIAAFAQDAVLTANFIAYPWVGEADATLDSRTTADGVAQPDERLGPLALLCDKNSTYGGGVAVVDPVNGNASALATWVAANQAAAEAAYVSATSNSYTTIGNAVQAIKAYNNANLSRNNPGGGMILLSGLTNVYPGTTPGADQGDMATWVTITRLSTLTRAQAGISSGTIASLKTKRVKVTGITLAGTSAALMYSGNITTDALWVDDNAINFTGASTPFYAWLAAHATHNVITAMTNGFKFFSTLQCPYGLVRGNTGPVTASGAGILSDAYNMLGNYNLRPWWVPAGNAYGQEISDNVVMAFNSHYGLSQSWMSPTAFNDLAHGFAVVQNLVERVSGVNPLMEIYASSVANPTNHVLLWHNTFAGQRLNIGYNDVGSTPYLHKNYSQRGNVFDEWNNKDDTFPTADGARTGAWPVGYNVGSVGNQRRKASDAEWFGEFNGLHSLNAGTLGFVDDASFNNGGGGDASGNGDYHLTSSGDGYDLIPAGAAVLPFDLEGTARTNEGGGSAGAFEMNPPVEEEEEDSGGAIIGGENLVAEAKLSSARWSRPT